MGVSSDSGQFSFGLSRGDSLGLLRRLRDATRAPGFPNPYELALVLSLSVVDVPNLPGGHRQLNDGRTILCAWHDDQRVRGTRVFEGIASAILWMGQPSRTVSEGLTMAARLAAPPLLMREIGIERTIERQPWATEAFLRWWWGCGRN